MSLELEHAVGCNVEFRNISHFHPNNKDYVKAVGGVVIVGDVQDPHEQTFLKGHDDFITCLAVSFNGTMAATGNQGANADVILWRIDGPRSQQMFCFQEQDHGIDCVCFSHDDQFLCCCGDVVDNRLFVYDTSTGLIIATAQLHPKPTISMISGMFVKDIKRRHTSEYQFAACGGKTVTLWHLDPQRGELTTHQVGSAVKQSREFVSLAFSQDYEQLFIGTTSGDIAIVVMKNRVLQAFVNVCGAGVMTLVCIPSPDRVRLLAGGGDGTLTVISGPSAMELREERQVHLDGPVWSLSTSSDHAEALAVTNVGTSFFLRVKDLSMKVHNQVSPGAVFDVAYPNGISDLFVTCCGDGIVTLWDANDYSAKIRCPVRTRTHPVSAAASQDIIVAGTNDGRVECFECLNGQSLWQIDNAHKGGVPSIKLASNCRFVVSGGAEGEVRVWEVKTREMASNLKEHNARITEVQLFPNDQYAISVSRDRCMLTWDLRCEKRLTSHREKHGGINCFSVALNQTTVVTAGQERTMTFWDLRQPDPTNVVSLDEEIFSIGFSPDDRYLATAGTDATVKIWDSVASQQLSSGTGHSRAIQQLAWSPDGKQVVSVGLDHSVLVWNHYA